MHRQWPFLIPFVSMAAGLAVSDHTSFFISTPVLVAGFVCLNLAAFHRENRLFIVCTALFFCLWGLYALTPWLLPDFPLDSIHRSASDNPVTVEGVIDSRPVVSAEGCRIVVRVEQISRAGNPQKAEGNLLLYVSEGDVALTRGDRIRFISRISVPRRLGLPGEFNYPRYLALQEISATARVTSPTEIVLMRGAAETSLSRSVDVTARRLGDVIRMALPDQRVASVLTALLIGDQKRIPQELADAYTRAGVNHILSISGFHVGVIAAFITVLFLWGLTRFEFIALRWNVRRTALLLTVPAMVYYLYLTGNAPATARSVIMLAACAVALYVERESEPINVLLMAAFLLVALHPPTLFDISFQLSFLSLWGIVIVVPSVTTRLSALKSSLLRTLLQFVTASVAASTVTLIPVLHTFSVASLNGILTNFLIVPLLGYGAVLTGFCALPLITLFPAAAAPLLWPAALLIRVSNWIIEKCSNLPVIMFRGITLTDMLLFLAVMCSTTFLKSGRQRLILGIVLPLIALMLHIVPPTSDGRLHITMLSVGQAESILLRHPDGSTTLVDGGGYLHDTGHDFGQRILAPALSALGVRRIDRIISTHDHPDHIGGLSYIARNFPVGEFWSTADGGTAENARDVLQAISEKHIPRRTLAAGDTISLPGGVMFSVYSPLSSQNTRPDNDTTMDVNEQSLVFHLNYGNFSMLFTADAGYAAEQCLLSGGYELESTVLKVGHHGSRYSTSTDFLKRVNPRLALISAGYGNRFGLPAPRTVSMLASRGISLYRTDRDGTIELVSDGVNWSVATPYLP
jgi:competence protein ComEC